MKTQIEGGDGEVGGHSDLLEVVPQLKVSWELLLPVDPGPFPQRLSYLLDEHEVWEEMLLKLF